MGLFTSPEDVLLQAILRQLPAVHLEHCTASLESIFKSALRKDPRILAYLQGYEGYFCKKSPVQLFRDYDVTLTYQDRVPTSLDDVIVDNGSWDPGELLRSASPDAVLVTLNEAALQTRIQSIALLPASLHEGFFGWKTNTMTFGSLSSYTLYQMESTYLLPLQDLRRCQGQAQFAARNLWRSILGRAQVPQFVKPFLALSYLSQECFYDQRAYDEVARDPTRLPTDPVPSLAYGPLVEKRGICGGLAWAFKRLMDEAGIECLCVTGHLKSDTSVGHMWNLVKLDGQYYHVDVTWGIKDTGVFIGGLLLSDKLIEATHTWDPSFYPVARGYRFDYDTIEEYLADNEETLLDDGATEKYLFPEDIVE